jgi:hypothetical protein
MYQSHKYAHTESRCLEQAGPQNLWAKHKLKLIVFKAGSGERLNCLHANTDPSNYFP